MANLALRNTSFLIKEIKKYNIKNKKLFQVNMSKPFDHIQHMTRENSIISNLEIQIGSTKIHKATSNNKARLQALKPSTKEISWVNLAKTRATFKPTIIWTISMKFKCSKANHMEWLRNKLADINLAFLKYYWTI